MRQRNDGTGVLALVIVLMFCAFLALSVWAFFLEVEEAKRNPGIEPGIAVPGASCDTKNAQRYTEDGKMAVCLLGPDEVHGGQHLEWIVQ